MALNKLFSPIDPSAVEPTDVAAVELPAIDRMFMEIAIDEAKRSRSEMNGRPNPFVGAVLVRNGSELGRAHRSEFNLGDHAEYTLLEKKLKGQDLRGATLYTTLEPCTKRSPKKTPCANWILQRGIGRVVVGILDPNQVICGKGIWKLREQRTEVSLCGSSQMGQIENMNQEFIQFHLTTPPIEQASRWSVLLSALKLIFQRQHK